MLSRNDLDRNRIAFDDHRLLADTGPLLPVTLAHHLRLGESDKMLTLVTFALAGGDYIDDADVLRTGDDKIKA